MHELFDTNSDSIGISYIRIRYRLFCVLPHSLTHSLSIGASDLNANVFTYDDVEGDATLEHFDLGKDRDLFELLREIKGINEKIKIIAAPWSAPTWMKDNNSTM